MTGSVTPSSRFGGVRALERRLKGRSPTLEQNKEAVAAELMAMAFTNITDILTWDDAGNVTVKPSGEISEAACRAIKKVKATTRKTDDGEVSEVEIEVHDKISTLRVLAKASGLLDKPENQNNAPSLFGINLVGADVIDVDADEVDDDG